MAMECAASTVAFELEDRPADARTPGGIPIRFRCDVFPDDSFGADREGLLLHLEHVRLGLLRGFDELLCLDGLRGVEHLPHQIETVRTVLRRFRGRVLLADEVGLGKTIEACLLLREYLLRGLVRRALILVPTALVSQWHDELEAKFGLEFVVPPRTGEADSVEFWSDTDRVLVSLPFAKSRRHFDLVTAVPWDLVIVDEAHHCKNRSTRNWQLVNALKRRHLFLLTATPVQNNLLELYNLLTLLEPGHLKTESDFKRQYVRRGNPRDPRNRERLRGLLSEVMIRHTRGLVQLDLPPRYAQTLHARPSEAEASLGRRLDEYLKSRSAWLAESAQADGAGPPPLRGRLRAVRAIADGDDGGLDSPDDYEAIEPASPLDGARPTPGAGHRLSRRQLAVLLMAAGSHPGALAEALGRIAQQDDAAAPLARQAAEISPSAKDQRLIELLNQNRGEKILLFANFLRTLEYLREWLGRSGIPSVMFSGRQSESEKDAAVEAFRTDVPVMLCSEIGGEGRNLQFARTLVNYDLPWNPMRIEQRVGRIHRIGQTREVFVFNLCTTGSLEAKLLDLLSEKIRMFELVVGEVGSILGNLQGGEEFESIVLDLWLRSKSEQQLAESFEALGDSLIEAQEEYLAAKRLDEALFGEDYQ